MYKLTEYRGKYCVYWRDPNTGQPLRRRLGTDDYDLARSRYESFKQLADAREQSGHQLIRDWWKAKQKALGTRRMAEAGIPMEEIAQYLGHANVEVTRKVYARYSPEYLRKAASALEI